MLEDSKVGSVNSFGTLFILAETAEDLMTSNLISLRNYQTVQEAAKLLIDHKIGVLPVIDDDEYPVGVVSKTDLVRYSRENINYCLINKNEVNTSSDFLNKGFQLEQSDNTTVETIMTPVVCSIKKETSAMTAVHEMLEKQIHHVFIVNEAGKLIGLISTFDIIKKIRSSHSY